MNLTNLPWKDIVFLSIALFYVALGIVGIAGFINSKSKKGQKLQAKVDAYTKMAEMAVTQASKFDGVSGNERKNIAIDFSQNEMKRLGYKNVSIELLGASIEKAYVQLKSTFDKAYNWGLSTNTDGTQNQADVNLNGIPDVQEKGGIFTGTNAVVGNGDKEAVVAIPTTTISTTTTTTQQSGLTRAIEDKPVKAGSLE